MERPHRTIKGLLENSSRATANPEPGSVLVNKPERAKAMHEAYQRQRARLEELLGSKGDMSLTTPETVGVMDVIERIYIQEIDADAALIECEKILGAHTEN